MTDFIKMDIFFATTTVAIVIATILFCIVLLYALRILRKLDRLSTLVVEEGEHIKEDIDNVRAGIHEKGAKFGAMIDFMTEAPKRLRSKKPTK